MQKDEKKHCFGWVSQSARVGEEADLGKKLAKPKAKEPHRTTPTFLLELPLRVNEGQATRIRGHLEAGRQFYNAVLSEGQRRLRRMQSDERCLPVTKQSEPLPSLRCVRCMASPNMRCTTTPK